MIPRERSVCSSLMEPRSVRESDAMRPQQKHIHSRSGTDRRGGTETAARGRGGRKRRAGRPRDRTPGYVRNPSSYTRYELDDGSKKKQNTDEENRRAVSDLARLMRSRPAAPAGSDTQANSFDPAQPLLYTRPSSVAQHRPESTSASSNPKDRTQRFQGRVYGHARILDVVEVGARAPRSQRAGGATARPRGFRSTSVAQRRSAAPKLSFEDDEEE
mmetsp:Transcript_8477/g.26263  ORF Transcript_8477/g.26263 Transcript_8477/m.26263 type:complete len:216 (-) Transcript_8477:29-676(-)